MSHKTAPPRPAEYVEQVLIDAILSQTYPPGSTLPGERDLAAQLGVTRPTLREALQRMARDGWLTIQQGKPTEVRDIWTEGGLNVLSSLVQYGHQVAFGIVPQLLEVRLILAPVYARAAVAGENWEDVAVLLDRYTMLEDVSEAYARFDWDVHHTLTIASGNPIYTLILNGFEQLYADMAILYFKSPEAREKSRAFYAALLGALYDRDADVAADVTRRVMAESLVVWNQVVTRQS